MITGVPMPSALGPVAAMLVVVTMGVAIAPTAARARRTLDAVGPHRWLSVVASPVVRRILMIAFASVVAILVGPLAFGVVVAVTVLARRVGPIRDQRRRRASIERALPEAMDLLVLSVRAGLTPFQAVRELATSCDPPIGEAFGEVVRRTERGHAFADALAALPEQLGPLAGGLADVIATSDRHGLPLGPVLDQLTVETRATRRRLDQADARKLPVRLSFPLVVCTLPSFVLLAIAPAVIAALSSLGAPAW